MSDPSTPVSPILADAHARIAAARKRVQSDELLAAVDDLEEVRVTLDGYTGEELLADELRAVVAAEIGLLRQRLGDGAAAVTSLARAETLQRALARRDGGPKYKLQLATTLINASGMHARIKQHASGLKMINEALDLLTELPEGTTPAQQVLRLGALQNKATLELGTREFEGAEATLKASFDLGETIISSGGHQLLPQVVEGTKRLNQLLRTRERAEEAMPYAEKVARWAEAAYEAGHPRGLPLYVNTQLHLVDMNFACARYADAEDHLWKAIDVSGRSEAMLMGTSFYGSLLRLDVDDASGDGLPRAEVVEAFDELIGKLEASGTEPSLMALVRARYALLVDDDVDGARAMLAELKERPDRVLPVTRNIMMLLESDLRWKTESDEGLKEH